jgi:hypothetical protein
MATMVWRFHRGGAKWNLWVGGRKESTVRQTKDRVSWTRRNVRGREEVFKTHLLLRAESVP